MAIGQLSVAVVGHANAGKTSLIRTLLRDSEFGEVADQAGTTRHVEGSAVNIGEENRLALFDTPGLEDSIRLFHILSQFFPEHSVDGVERLRYFLDHLPSYPELDQEAKVLRALLDIDLIFYVIDLREPILGKYRDELQILSYAAKPVIPVLNFTRQGGEHLALWKQQLARLNFHAYVSFDNVHFDFSDEMKIYQKMQTLLPDQEGLLNQLILQRQQQWADTFELATQIVAKLFVECAALRYQVDNSEQALQKCSEELQRRIRKAENKCVAELLTLYQFRQEDVKESQLPVAQDGWHLDLFSADNLQELGINITGNIAKGVGAGVAIDLMTAGMSLGAAAITGGVAGALWSVKQRYYDEIYAKVTGSRYICLDDVTLQVLWLRQNKLLQILQQRGHASFDKIDLEIGKEKLELPQHWHKWLRRARSHPDWSSLNGRVVDNKESKRIQFIDTLAAAMHH